MSNFTYKKSTVSSIKMCGVLNLEENTINIDGSDKSINELLADFDGAFVTMSVKIQENEKIDINDIGNKENEEEEDDCG